MLLSIVEKQRQAALLAFQEGAILSHRHFLSACYSRAPFKGVSALDNAPRKKRSPAIPRKFSAEEAAQIRQDYLETRSYRQLAKKYNCGLRCVNQIIQRWGAYKSDP